MYITKSPYLINKQSIRGWHSVSRQEDVIVNKPIGRPLVMLFYVFLVIVVVVVVFGDGRGEGR